MASTFITVSKAFTSHNNNNNPSSLSNQRLLGGCRNSVRVCAIAKEIEPTKVVPQADRVLIRLEKLPEKTALGVLLPKSAVQFEHHLMGEILAVGAEVEQVEAGKKVLFSDINAYEVDLGTDARHCFCKADDLLALVE
ncbi:unnamed protein product [Camellia sinensis]|uniref:Uncharacterized protein n=1 Tax=Camellia sinensis TaxID=4442 RepID=A0A7J7HMW5_CAMSI|nr:hypothetical protein HYC85_006194 [Camellia sinensis]